MASLTIVLIIIIGVVGAVLAVNYFEERAKEQTDILGPLHDDRLCKSHTWSKMALVTTEQFERIYKEGSEVPAKHTFRYCTTCGFIPDLDKMVRPLALGKLVAQEVMAKQRKQDREDLEELKQTFFEAALKDETSLDRAIAIRKGYDLYDQFVTVLPQLLAEKQVKRLMKELEIPQKKVD